MTRTGKRLKRAAAGSAAATLLMGAALWGGAPTAQANSGSSADNATFTIGMTNEVDSFNPFNGIEAESYEAWALMYDYMISWSPDDMSPQTDGGLATSWDTSADGLTWTFHIRTGVKWNDGVPLTAKDIAYTYNRILDGGPESASWGSYLTSVTSITAPDDKTVVLKLEKPNAVLPLLPMPIVPEHIWKSVSEDDVKTYSNEPAGASQPVVGSGPFELVEGKAGASTYRFVRNDSYWGGKPKVAEVDMQVYRSEDTLVQSLKAGEIDFAEGVSALQVKALQGQDGITAQEGNSPGFDEIAFNTGSVDLETGAPMGDPNPAVLDKKFRFALNFAIDRNVLAQKAYQGAAIPAENIIPPAYKGYVWSPPSPDAYAYDPEKAKQLLDAAGYKVGSDGFRTMPDGSPIGQLRLYSRSESPESVSTMAFLQEWLNDVQIDSKVTSYESSKLTNVILDGEFDVFQWGWYVEPDPDSILSYFTCGQRGNWSDSWYCNPAYDKLYKEQNAATDQSERETIVKRMQAMLYDDAPYLNTVYNQIGEAYRSDRWEGFVPQPRDGGILLFQYGHANYLNVAPVGTATGNPQTASASSSDSSGGSSTVLVIVVIVVLAAAAVAGWLMMRRRTADTRE
ncbi:MAG: ABC transporter substrate-binding protein [Nocardioidaceae bacterium]